MKQFQTFLSKLRTNAIKPLNLFKGQFINWNSYLHSSSNIQAHRNLVSQQVNATLLFSFELDSKVFVLSTAVSKSIWWFDGLTQLLMKGESRTIFIKLKFSKQFGCIAER